jgi:hypothetical protein
LSELFTIRLFRDALEATAAKELLEAAGIGAVVVYEQPAPLNAHHHYPTLESAELQVRAEDRDRALAVLDGQKPE